MTGGGSLPRRRLGARGPEVGAIGFGSMALSGVYGQADDRESIKVIHAALDAGVNHLDTANSYGAGHNETLLGKALAGRRDQVVLATKFGIQSEGLGRPQRIRDALEESLLRLDVEYLDIYYMHRFDPTTPLAESIGTLAELVQEGKIRHIGLSEVSPETLRAAHAIHPITVVQQEYSLMTRDLEDDLLPTMRELGVGLVAYSPLARGMLTGAFRAPADLSLGDARRERYPRYAGENLLSNLDLAGRVFALATSLGMTPTALALGWVLAQGQDIVPIPGTRRLANLKENLTAARTPLPAAVVRQLEAAVPKGAAVGDRYNEAMSRRLDH